MSIPETANVVFSVVGALIVLPLLIIAIIDYVLSSKALYAIAKRRGAGKPAHAWVPILKDRLIGQLAEQFERAQYNRSKKYSLLMLLFSVVNAVRLVTVVALYALTPGITEALINADFAGAGSFVSNIINLTNVITYGYTAVWAFSMYRVWYSLIPEGRVRTLIFSLLFPLYGGIRLNQLKNSDAGFIELMEKRRQA